MTTLMSTHSLQMSAGHLPLFDNLDLSIRSGDRIGLIGANGCGKSTLLALLAGQRQPHDGRIHKATPCRCEFVAQHLPAQLQALSTRAVLLDALANEAGQAWQVDKMLTELQLAEQADFPVSALSGGPFTDRPRPAAPAKPAAAGRTQQPPGSARPALAGTLPAGVARRLRAGLPRWSPAR